MRGFIMPRVFLCVWLLLAGLLPVTVLGLGLGEINPKSALNQPFVAEIPVVLGAGDDVAQLQVALASADTFERYGLNRPLFLSDFEFRVINDPGRSVVRIVSATPVIEPFVTLLLEVQWPQGRLLREYTVLLDPPVFSSAQPATSAPAPATPRQPAQSQVTRPQSAPAPTAAAPRPAPSMSAAGDFGPVARNDTLWGIAQRMRPDASIDTNQMMLAIYRANPEAFAGNINQLKAGVILRAPSAGELASLSKSEAFAEVRRQNQDWRSGSRVPAETPRLRLVPPPAEAGEGSDQTVGAMDTPPAPDVSRTASDDARVMQLEAELANRERMLQLKDQELATLQDQLAEIRQSGETAEMDLDAPVDETPLGQAADSGEAPGDPMVDEAEPMAEPAAEVPAEPVVDVPSSLPPAVSTTSSQESPSFFGQLLGSVLFWAGLLVAVALVLGLVLARRRRSDDATGRWEQLADAEDIDADAREATERLRAPVGEPEETFVVEEGEAGATDALDDFASGTTEIDRSGDQELPLERTLSSDAGLNLDQSDPISEAEFHMAYGLYDQAADLLIAALAAEPERRDLRRKLLDVYFVWENKGGFLKEAETFHNQVGSSDSDWNKVLIMGKQLCPEESLFEAQATNLASDEGMDLELFEGGESEEVDLPLGEDSEDLDMDLSAMGDADEDMLDFDLGGASIDEEDLSPTKRDDGSDSPTMESPTIEAEGLGSPTMESPTLEQPMNESTMESPTIEVPTSETTMETPTIESPMVDFPIGSVEEDRTANTGETASLDLDELGLDLSAFEDMDDASDAVEPDNANEPGGSQLADDDATLLAGDLDDETLLRKVGEGLDSTAEVESISVEQMGNDDDLGGFLDVESTAEVRTVEPASDKSDTLEQPRPEVDDTAEQPAPAADVDLDIGEFSADEDSPTGTLDMPERRPEGPTMTEVGTKLDLARAYIDMGDPEGARSILGEVVDEGDEAQRQEAQKLIDDLAD